MDKQSGLQLLRTSLNSRTAQFRAHQWEAIDFLVNQRQQLLVVERTGWGKSSVYFIGTRILRNQGKGPTVIISPLLALMRNQIDSAEKLGIRAVTINSTNVHDWGSIKMEILADKVDALLISPERLGNEQFVEQLLRPIANRIGLFVVDEAHCISDWGHDFRTDYRRIINILKFMPAGMPVLGTTATANDRVIKDIESQLGKIRIIRGSLVRESLLLQNTKLKNKSERLAWLQENIPSLPGSGIIYTLTIRDAVQTAEYLSKFSIKAAAYYAGVVHEGFTDSDSYRQHLEENLYNNRIKVLVATSALGMGYDKPDLGFVVHYQAPGSIIAYYQQIGRAGRAIDQAYCILLSGEEDGEILQYFIDSAFPSEDHVNLILDVLSESDGLSTIDLTGVINLRHGQIDHALKYLSVEQPSPVFKSGSKWARTAVPYVMDKAKIERLSIQKRKEWQQVQEYIDYRGCLMNFLQEALDDPIIEPCGKCSNCRNQLLLNEMPKHKNVIEASVFLKHSEFELEVKKQVKKGALPQYSWSGHLSKDLRAEVGRSLSRWGDAGWGKLVAEDKHKGIFREELVTAVVEMITERWHPEPVPAWVTCVPSHRHPRLVPDFAKKVAERLSLPFLPIVQKIKDTPAQKDQQNSYFQCQNLDGAFEIAKDEVLSQPVLLVDDVVDSGWTFAIIAALLRQAGSGPVYPVALSSTAVN